MTTVKAKLGNRGSGMLEFVDNKLKFYVERGRFKKQSETVREIPLADIEKATVEGKEFSVTWKGVADVFVVEKGESANTICEEINSALLGQAEILKDKEPSNQECNELVNLVKGAWDISDSMFDILMNLQGRVNWNRQEIALKRSEEIVKNLPIQHTNRADFDFTRLTSTIRTRSPEEAAKAAYNILKSLNGYLNDLSINNVALQKIHPNYDDVKQMALAYYILNDIIFGTIVGDKEIEKEKNELLERLDELSKTMEYKIDTEVIKRATDSLARALNDENKESLVVENRAVFRQQFEDLLTK